MNNNHLSPLEQELFIMQEQINKSKQEIAALQAAVTTMNKYLVAGRRLGKSRLTFQSLFPHLAAQIEKEESKLAENFEKKED